MEALPLSQCSERSRNVDRLDTLGNMRKPRLCPSQQRAQSVRLSAGSISAPNELIDLQTSSGNRCSTQTEASAEVIHREDQTWL